MAVKGEFQLPRLFPEEFPAAIYPISQICRRFHDNRLAGLKPPSTTLSAQQGLVRPDGQCLIEGVSCLMVSSKRRRIQSAEVQGQLWILSLVVIMRPLCAWVCLTHTEIIHTHLDLCARCTPVTAATHRWTETMDL